MAVAVVGFIPSLFGAEADCQCSIHTNCIDPGGTTGQIACMGNWQCEVRENVYVICDDMMVEC